MIKNLRIVFLYILFLFIIPAVHGQILLSESFEQSSFPPSGWSLQNASSGNNWVQNILAANAVSGTKSMELPVAPNDNNAWAISPAINLVAGGKYRVSYWYKTTNSLYNKTLKVTMGNEPSQQNIVLHNYTRIVNASFLEGVDVFTASESGSFYFGFNSAYYYHAAPDGLFVDSIVIQKINPCTGIPTAGTASGPAEICAGTNFTINVTGSYIDDNIIFQWQSSVAGANNFSDISGGTAQSLTTSQISAMDYRCKIICANAGFFSVSNTVAVALKPSYSCYCTPHAFCPDVNPITNINFAGINNTSSCVNEAYGDYTKTVPPANVTGGTTVPISLKVGKNAVAYAAAWIDYNDNGLFETNEYTYLGSGNDSIKSNIFIPSATIGGLKRMRVRLRPLQKLTATDACTFITAETEDYEVMVTPAKITILYTPFTDTLYDPSITITANIKQRDVGLNTSDSLGPRIWVKRQSDVTWKSFKGTFTAGTSNDGSWQFPVNHDMLGIRHNGCDSVQYYFVAQDLSDTAYIGYLPEPGSLHTDVRTQINPPPILFGYRLKPRLKDTILVNTSDCRYQSLSNENGLFQEIGKRKLEGDLTIIIGSDLSETGFYALKDSFQNGHKVTIRPDGNTIRSITHDYSKYNPKGQTGILKLIGTKRLTIDGSYQNTGEYLRFISQPSYTMSTYDTLCSIRISDNADSITIKNCSFRTDNETPYIAEASIVVAHGINKNILILNNEFSNITAYKMAERYLVSFNGTNTLTVRGNRFNNYRQSAINIATPTNNWIIDSNHFYRTMLPSVYSYSTEAINISGGGHLVTGNYIGGSAPFCAGSPMIFVDNPSSNIVGIKISPTITTISNIITNNRIDNINATTGGYAAEAASFAGILCVDNNCIIKDNIIGNPLNTTPSITILADQIFGIQSYGSQDNEISSNIISALKNNGSNGAIRLYGIYRSNVAGGFSVATAVSKIQNNKIFNLTNTLNTSAFNSSVSSDLGGTAGIYIIGGTTNLIQQNEIHNLSVTSGHISGIAYEGGPKTSDTTFIQRNNIYDLYNTSSQIGSCCGDDLYNGIINGIGISGGSSGLDIINNRISITNRDLPTPASIRGIFEANRNSGTAPLQRILYNSVYIGGTTTDNGGTAGYFSLYSRVRQVYNNIFYTDRTGGTKGHYAYRFVGDQNSYPQKANNNLYVLPDTSLFADRGNNFYSNFAAWKPLARNDSASYFTSPAVIPSSQFFIDKKGGNLNIDSTKDICWYVNGKGLPFAGIKADFDSVNIRSDAIQRGATDIGSDEFTSSTTPPLLTVYGRHVPGGADTLSCNDRIVAVITWGSGGTLPSLGNCRWYSGRWPNDTTNNGAAISAPYLNAYWSIPAVGGANYTYSLKLFYDSSILGKISSPQNMVVNKKQINVQGTWQVIIPTFNNSTEQTLTVDGQTSFSEFTATDLLYALPLSLVLNGRKVSNDIKLTWEDQNAANVLWYGIERSRDGIKFSNIANIAGNAGTGYQYTDVGILKTAEVFHYRLKLINNTDKITYTNIITFRNGELNSEEITKVYPNPFTKRITLEITSGKLQTISLRLLSANGYTVTNSELKIAKGNSVVTMDTPDRVPPGTYLLQVITEKGSYSFKLVKN